MPNTRSASPSHSRCRPVFLQALLTTLLAGAVGLGIREEWPRRAVDYVRHIAFCLKTGDYTRNSVFTNVNPDGSISMVVI